MLPPLLENITGRLAPVGLDEMDSVKLMNRVDTKYVMSAHRLPSLFDGLDGHYRVLETGGTRISPYETCYLDDNCFRLFDQHVIGKPVRYKVRFRTYSSTGSTFLEVKKRTAASRTVKWRISRDTSLAAFSDDEALQFLRGCLPFGPEGLSPVLLNSFKRITLVEKSFRERATIDFDLSFSDMSGKVLRFPFITIIELKREGYGSFSPLAGVLRELSVNPSGFSKYCVGVSVLYNIPRRNLLRDKISVIKKIENEYNSCCSA